MKKNIDPIATSALIGAVLCWATVPLFLKYFTPYIDAWTANGIRYPFAALLYLPWLIHFHLKGRLAWHHWKLALLPVAINTVSQIAWAWAPYYIDPGLMAFLIRLSTLWTVLGSFVLFHDERRLVKSARFWWGLILALVGFIILTVAGKPLTSTATAIGVTLVMLTSIGWAGYQLSVRRNMQHMDSRAAFGMIAVLTSIGLITCMFSFGNYQQIIGLPVQITGLVLLSGLVGIATAHLLFYIAVKRIGVAIASSANLASSFITAILSTFLFGEMLHGLQWIAGLLLIIGALFLTQSQIFVLRKY